MILRRFASTRQGTPGRLDSGLYTMERPDLGNEPFVSRIPAGKYICVRTWYHKGGYDTYEIISVPDRTRILFHWGNRMIDVNGCVCMGMKFGTYKGQLAVLNSRVAFKRFMKERNGIFSFPLTIIDED